MARSAITGILVMVAISATPPVKAAAATPYYAVEKILRERSLVREVCGTCRHFCKLTYRWNDYHEHTNDPFPTGSAMTTCLRTLVAMVTTSDMEAQPLATWLKGRALASLIREDMTMKQVEQILGPSWGFGSVCTGGILFIFWDYNDFGVGVKFIGSSKNDVWVTETSVDFWPLPD